jgi:hypothetical protein
MRGILGAGMKTRKLIFLIFPAFLLLCCEHLKHTNPFDPQTTFSTFLEEGEDTLSIAKTVTTEGNPYYVTKNLVVNSTLTIEPGVILKFATGVKLDIRGRLIARGTEGNNIKFIVATSGTWAGMSLGAHDSGNVLEYCEISDCNVAICPKVTIRHCRFINVQFGYISMPSDTAGSIGPVIDSNLFNANNLNTPNGITLDGVTPVHFFSNTVFCAGFSIGGSAVHLIKFNSIFTHVSCGRRAVPIIWNNKIQGTLGCDSASPDIRYNRFVNPGFIGSWGILLRGGSNPIIKYNVFDSIKTGISIRTTNDPGVGVTPINNNPVIESNNFDKCDSSGISLQISGGSGEAGQTTDISAPDNWWGTVDSATIETKIYDYVDDIKAPHFMAYDTLGRVSFTPFRTAPVPADSVGPGW